MFFVMSPKSMAGPISFPSLPYPITSGPENFPRRSTTSYGNSPSGNRAFSSLEKAAPSQGHAGPPYYHYHSIPTDYGLYSNVPGSGPMAPVGRQQRPVSVHMEWDAPVRTSPDSFMRNPDSPKSAEVPEYLVEIPRPRASEKSNSLVKYHSQRRSSNRDEFDGPHQLLELPSPQIVAAQERDLPYLPTSLDVSEQDQILCQVNDRLSQCAFDFIAKYQFPIPLEPDKREVRVPADREWTEWVYLLKRLATKRRVPARVLYNGQIKQLVTVLENSLEMRHAAKHQSRPVKDDRNVLQLISAGTQVAKILRDASAMEDLDRLYVQTELRVQERRSRRIKFTS